MSVGARIVADALELDRVAGTYLRRRPGQHHLHLGLLERLRVEPRLYGHEPLLAVAERDGEIVGVAMRTPPYGLLLSAIDVPDAIPALAAAVAGNTAELPYVLGAPEPARAFATAWARLSGQQAVLGVRERIHACERVVHDGDAPGVRRPVEPADRDLLVEWLRAFVDEALGESHGDVDVADRADDYLDPATPAHAYLWLEQGPVSLAACGPAGPGAARVGPVYTPPEHRGRGYATALVGRLTGELLAAGNEACFLYTDLANASSNAIYARIGYEPVADAEEWRFEPG